MRPLTLNALIVCDHGGKVFPLPSQLFVRIDGAPILVEGDTLGKAIVGCPNAAWPIKPCTSTLSLEAGLSSLLHINGKPALLSSTSGGTDGTPPMATKYKVLFEGHALVSVDG
jgi:hypothetical protein